MGFSIPVIPAAHIFYTTLAVPAADHKVTSPLGSHAAMRWGSSPHARTKDAAVI